MQVHVHSFLLITNVRQVMPILQMRTLRLKVKQMTQGPADTKNAVRVNRT